MKGYTHLAIGLGAGLIMKDTLGTWGVIMTGLGSLLPDLDHPGSMLGRRIFGISALGLKHRGWMHSLVGLIVFASLFMVIDPKFVPGITLGYFLHLLADTLNPAGIAWLYPISRKRVYIIGVPSGSPLEFLFILWLVYIIIEMS